MNKLNKKMYCRAEIIVMPLYCVDMLEASGTADDSVGFDNGWL